MPRYGALRLPFMDTSARDVSLLGAFITKHIYVFPDKHHVSRIDASVFFTVETSAREI